MEPINVFDFEQATEANLPNIIYDYYAAGAHDEIALRENRAAYDRIKLRYRVLRDISSRDLSTTILGQKSAMPIIISPTAVYCCEIHCYHDFY